MLAISSIKIKFMIETYKYRYKYKVTSQYNRHFF